jgi:hypothetical protein
MRDWLGMSDDQVATLTAEQIIFPHAVERQPATA